MEARVSLGVQRRSKKIGDTDLVYGRHKSLHRRVSLRSCKEIVESWRCDDAGHDALVISKKHESCIRISKGREDVL